jgi:hypothetical protein
VAGQVAWRPRAVLERGVDVELDDPLAGSVPPRMAELARQPTGGPNERVNLFRWRRIGQKVDGADESEGVGHLAPGAEHRGRDRVDAAEGLLRCR